MEIRALITGGAGFLGPHVVDRALRQGWQVAVVDDFSAGRREHLEPFRNSRRFRLFEGDLTDPAFVRSAVRETPPEVVFHLAALHFIPHCVANPVKTLKVNVLGTQVLLDALEPAPARCFIFASTADVYAPSDSPHREGDTLGSYNIYGLSKMFGEQLLGLARRRYPACRFLVARLFNLIGRGETNPHVLPEILAGLRRGDKEVRLGNMEPRRDYVPAADVADALVRMAAYEGNHAIFNLGTGVGRSVWDLIRALESVAGTRIQVEIDPRKVRASERPNLVADNSLARRELGWTAGHSLEETLRETLEQEFAPAGR